MKKTVFMICIVFLIFSIGCAGVSRRGNGTHISAINTTVDDKTTILSAIGAGVGLLIGNHNGETFQGGVVGALAGGLIGMLISKDKKEDPYQEAYHREMERLEYREKRVWENQQRRKARSDARRDFYSK